MFRRAVPLAWLAFLLPPTGLRSQELAPVISRTCGLQHDAGTLWALGPDYKARFLEDGVEFTPALGPAAPRNFPLRFELTAFGRRGVHGTLWSPAPAVARRSTQERRVSFERGVVTEIYDVRPEGLEQSFRFDALPAGEGDLVVRGVVHTEFEPTPADDGVGLAFQSGELGGVHFGAVTGIDARGRRMPGTITCSEGTLELTLPRAFVETATLPLVLDPLIGTTLTVASGFDEKEPDAAALILGSTPDFLVVWARTFSNGDVDVRGQRVRNDGTLLGGLIGIRTNATLVSDQPSVAAVKLRERWVVVWREGSRSVPSYLAAASVDGTTGAVSGAIQVVAGTDAFTTPDVGGDGAELGDQAIAVWENATQNRIEGARIAVSATGTLNAFGRSILSPGGTHSAPAIAQDGGADGRFLVVWQSSSTFTEWVGGVLVDRFLNVIDRPSITSASTVRRTTPDVSGDGLHWVVVYDRRSDLLTPPDVYARWVTLDPRTNAAYLGTEVLVDGGSGTQTGGAVATLGRSTLVAFRQENGRTGLQAAAVRSLDRFSCGPCEGFSSLEGGVTTDVPRIVATGRFRDGLLVWESVVPATGVGTIRARAFREDAGSSLVFLNSACGPDVAVPGSCSRPGNLGYHVRLEHAEPNAPAFLLFQPGSPLSGVARLTCGTCIWVLDPFRSLLFPAGTTDAHGDLAFPLPIPSTVPPATWSVQFGYVPSASAGCAPLGLSFSRIGTIGT